ncbi:MAG TPA: hypothetical protein VH330_09100 [Candidatus Udaeobacter sp.]|jgi:hypothetical protein
MWYRFCFAIVGAVWDGKDFKEKLNTLMAAHMVLVIVGTLIMGAITGFVFSNEGALFWGLAGQILHGLLTIVCFALVGVAFWRFGWKVGTFDLVLLFIAGNIALFLQQLEKQ